MNRLLILTLCVLYVQAFKRMPPPTPLPAEDGIETSTYFETQTFPDPIKNPGSPVSHTSAYRLKRFQEEYGDRFERYYNKHHKKDPNYSYLARIRFAISHYLPFGKFGLF